MKLDGWWDSGIQIRIRLQIEIGIGTSIRMLKVRICISIVELAAPQISFLRLNLP